MTPEDQAEAFLQNDALEKAQAYARRGRRNERVAIDELCDLWVVAFKVWASDVGNPLLRSMVEDLESELVLRGVTPPHERVREAADKLRMLARQLLDDLSPDEYRRVATDIERDVRAFSQSARAAKKN